MKSASEGTGVIAGLSAREILELVGVTDILMKIRGSKNKINVARAIIEGLKTLRLAELVVKLRGKEVKEILN
jgi:small subunit ribosomal protein S5